MLLFYDTKYDDIKKVPVQTINYINNTGGLGNFISVDKLPSELPEISGKETKLYVNLETVTAFYDYIDRVYTPEEKMKIEIEEQQKKIDLQQKAIDDLVMNVLPSLMPQ